jgi:DNA-binding CsgD family transcriptional regulator
MPARLTPRERRVVELIAEDLSCPAIGRRLRISAWTVRAHVRAVAAKCPGVGTPLERIRENAETLLAA